MNRAFICRFGHQDIYRLLGRDPLRRPLTPLETALFAEALETHWEAEVKPRVDIGLPPPT
jgi:hypothetical protein